MNIIQQLEKYFKETSKEQVIKDWEETRSYNNVGMKVDDFWDLQSDGKEMSESIEICEKILSDFLEKDEATDAEVTSGGVYLSEADVLTLMERAISLKLDSHALYNVSPAVWLDNKGRTIEIHTMSDKWLNNIRKKFKGTDKVKPILAEIKRRKLKRNGR